MYDDMLENKGLTCQHVQACLHAGLPSIPPFEVVIVGTARSSSPCCSLLNGRARWQKGALKLQWQIQAIAHLGMDTFDEIIRYL